MKKLYYFGIIVLGLFFTVNLSGSVQATTNTPSQAEFEEAINPIRDLANNSSQNPKFSSEHQYLTAIIKEADKVLADYSHADTQLITDLMAAATDAYKGCQLIFNAESALASRNATTSTINTPATPATPAPTTIKTATATTDTPVIAKQKTAVEPESPVLETVSTKTSPTTTAEPQPANIDNADTAKINEKESSPNSEQLSTITVAQTTTLCVAAGALAISNRDKLRHRR